MGDSVEWAVAPVAVGHTALSAQRICGLGSFAARSARNRLRLNSRLRAYLPPPARSVHRRPGIDPGHQGCLPYDHLPVGV